MEIISNASDFKTEIADVLHAFFPTEFLKNSCFVLKHKFELLNNTVTNKLFLDYKVKDLRPKSDSKQNEICISEATYIGQINFKNNEEKNEIPKNSVKFAVYKFFSSFLNKKLQWGTLTDNNPIKIVKNLIKNDEDLMFLEENLIENYAVEPEKTKLISKIVNIQKNFIYNENLVNLYINIGFNSNSNFINFAINNFEILKNCENKSSFYAIFPKYFETLIKEIKAVKKMIAQKAFVVKTIYIGGDIALLNANELDILLQELAYHVSEFTVECCSPHHLTKDKLQVLKSYAVSRIFLNAESFTQKTLKQLKKDFSFQDILNFYKNALEFDFKINIGLIAGLTFENLKSFKKNLKLLLELSPDNVTINVAQNFLNDNSNENENLNEKNNTNENNSNEKNNTNENNSNEMLDIKSVIEEVNFATQNLILDGYNPYFIFKEQYKGNQKDLKNELEFFNNQINKNESIINADEFKKSCSELLTKVVPCDEIEIIGYCKSGKQSIFDSDCVLKNSTTIGLGANSTTSRVVGNEIKNQFNPKTMHEYISHLDEIIIDKEKLFNNYF